MIKHKLVVLLTMQIFLSGCDEISRGGDSTGCDANASVKDGKLEFSNPNRKPQCQYGLVMMCYSCVYKDNGMFSHSKSDVCGVCIGGSLE
jgi:hypothetical protein